MKIFNTVFLGKLKKLLLIFIFFQDSRTQTLYLKKISVSIRSSFHVQKGRIARNGDVQKELDTEKVASNSVQLQMQKLLASEHAFAIDRAVLSGKAFLIVPTCFI